MSVASVYVTFGSGEEARRIGRQMIEERLAACINILGPCYSIYRWQGEVEEAHEVAAIFKTSAQTAPALAARITELHSYDLPAATVWPISDLAEEYRAWILENSSG